LGRCRIQAWPRSSIETLDTWPQTYLPGSLGQDGSTSNFGISRVCAATGCAPWPASMTIAGMASRQRAIARMDVLPCFHVIKSQHDLTRGYLVRFSLHRIHSLLLDDRSRFRRA